MDEKGPAGGYGAAPSGDEMGGTGSAAPMIENRGGVASAGGAAGRSGGGEAQGPDREESEESEYGSEPSLTDGTPSSMPSLTDGTPSSMPSLTDGAPSSMPSLTDESENQSTGSSETSESPCAPPGRPPAAVANVATGAAAAARSGTMTKKHCCVAPGLQIADNKFHLALETGAAVAARQQRKVYSLDFFKRLEVVQPYSKNNAALKWFIKRLCDESANGPVNVFTLEDTAPIATIIPGRNELDYGFRSDGMEQWSWLQMIAHLCEEDMKTVVEGQDGRSGGLVSCEVFMLQPCREFATSLPEIRNLRYWFVVTCQDGSVVWLHPQWSSEVVDAVVAGRHVSLRFDPVKGSQQCGSSGDTLYPSHNATSTTQTCVPRPRFKAPPAGMTPPADSARPQFKAPPPVQLKRNATPRIDSPV